MQKHDEEYVNVNIYIPKSLHEAVKAILKPLKISFSALVTSKLKELKEKK